MVLLSWVLVILILEWGGFRLAGLEFYAEDARRDYMCFITHARL
jgi:hypothetical protein